MPPTPSLLRVGANFGKGFVNIERESHIKPMFITFTTLTFKCSHSCSEGPVLLLEKNTGEKPPTFLTEHCHLANKVIWKE